MGVALCFGLSCSGLYKNSRVFCVFRLFFLFVFVGGVLDCSNLFVILFSSVVCWCGALVLP